MLQQDYRQALGHYFQKRYHTALEQSSYACADEWNKADHLRLYRLWIEVLSALDHHDSLQYLARHLVQQADQNPAQKNDLMGLAGLCYLKNDQITTLKHFFLVDASLRKTIQKWGAKKTKSPYETELILHLVDRLSIVFSIKEIQNMVEYLDPNEYFHISLRFSLAESKKNQKLENQAIQQLEALYPQAPLLWMINLRDEYQHSQNLAEPKNLILTLLSYLEKYPMDIEVRKLLISTYTALSSQHKAYLHRARAELLSLLPEEIQDANWLAMTEASLEMVAEDKELAKEHIDGLIPGTFTKLGMKALYNKAFWSKQNKSKEVSVFYIGLPRSTDSHIVWPRHLGLVPQAADFIFAGTESAGNTRIRRIYKVLAAEVVRMQLHLSLELSYELPVSCPVAPIQVASPLNQADVQAITQSILEHLDRREMRQFSRGMKGMAHAV